MCGFLTQNKSSLAGLNIWQQSNLHTDDRRANEYRRVPQVWSAQASRISYRKHRRSNSSSMDDFAFDEEKEIKTCVVEIFIVHMFNSFEKIDIGEYCKTMCASGCSTYSSCLP